MNYQEANAKLTGRNSQRRKLANNTYLERRDNGRIAVKLHATDIITYHPEGTVELSAGGRWRTVTTKARMNEYIPYGFSISQRKGQWYVSSKNVNYQDYPDQYWYDVCLFEDGLVLHPDGAVTGGLPLEDAKAAQKLRKDARKYAKGYVKALRAGEVSKPGPGDCWGCYLVGKDAGSSHILGHFDEKYYVPSLLVRAFESYPVSIAMKDQVARIWEGDLTSSWGEFVFDQIEKTIYRFCLRELGQAS